MVTIAKMHLCVCVCVCVCVCQNLCAVYICIYYSYVSELACDVIHLARNLTSEYSIIGDVYMYMCRVTLICLSFTYTDIQCICINTHILQDDPSWGHSVKDNGATAIEHSAVHPKHARSNTAVEKQHQRYHNEMQTGLLEEEREKDCAEITEVCF